MRNSVHVLDAILDAGIPVLFLCRLACIKNELRDCVSHGSWGSRLVRAVRELRAPLVPTAPPGREGLGNCLNPLKRPLPGQASLTPESLMRASCSSVPVNPQFSGGSADPRDKPVESRTRVGKTREKNQEKQRRESEMGKGRVGKYVPITR